jgi:hypothetical protein
MRRVPKRERRSRREGRAAGAALFPPPVTRGESPTDKQNQYRTQELVILLLLSDAPLDEEALSPFLCSFLGET